MSDHDLHHVDQSPTTDASERRRGRDDLDDPESVARSTGQHDLRGLDPSAPRAVDGDRTTGTSSTDETGR